MKVGAFLLSLAALLAASSQCIYAQQAQWDKYLWQTSRTSNISPAARSMVTELQAETQKVLDAGPLAPFRAVYADTMNDMYFMYWQGGRIVTTLAMAYPYLTRTQQAAVRKYVQAELDSEERAPWCPQGYIAADKGARRELHSFNEGNG
jgi:hypothetical protein